MDFRPFDAFLDGMSAKGLPGYDVTVRIGYEQVYRRRWGCSDRESGSPLTSDTLYALCSVTKLFTCVTALTLYEKGAFTMDEPVARYLPEYEYLKVREKDGTVRPARTALEIGDLFAMRSGIASYPRGAETDPLTTRKLAMAIAYLPLSFDPGTRWQYGASHDVLGALIEVWSGRNFYEAMKENVLDRLGCRDTYFFPPDPSRIAVPYRFVNGEVVREDRRTMPGRMRYESGGGGLYATVDDCARLMEMLANGGAAATGERVLSQGTVDMMRTNCLNENCMRDFNWPRMRGYGYGFGVRTLVSKAYGSNGSIGEFGWAGAAGAYALADPERKLSMYYAQHVFDPQEDWLHTRLRNVLYGCV